jgi:Leucine Rich repeat
MPSGGGWAGREEVPPLPPVPQDAAVASGALQISAGAPVGPAPVDEGQSDDDDPRAGLHALTQLLHGNTLTRLVVAEMLACDYGDVSEPDACEFADALRENTSLTELTCTKECFDFCKCIQDVVRAACLNRTLVHAAIRRCGVDDGAAAAMAAALSGNTTLKTLDLSRNLIGDSGAYALVRALQANTTLAVLVLDCNGIGGAGAACLARVLKQHNQTVAEFSIASNRIGNDGV